MFKVYSIEIIILLKMCQGDYQKELLNLHSVLSLEKDCEGNLNKELYTARLQNCQESFRGSAEKNILLFRLSTIEYIKSIEIGQLTSFHYKVELPLLRLIRHKLCAINNDVDQLIQEGILTLYIDLNDIRQQILKNSEHNILNGLIMKIFQNFNPLLKQYFIFQQYQVRAKIDNEKRKSFLSIQTSQSEGLTFQTTSNLDEKILLEVQEFISGKHLAELFEEEMKKEQNKMVETLQICRICFKCIKLYNLEKHVNDCAKRCELNIQIDSKKYEIGQLEQKLKARYKQSCEEMVITRMDEDFRRICRLILNPTRKTQRSTNKRNSLACFKEENNTNRKIEALIEDYMEEFGNDELLLEVLLQKYKEKNLLEKRLSNLEMNIYYQEEPKEPSSPSSSIRKRTNSSNRIKKMLTKMGQRYSGFLPAAPSSLQTSPPLCSSLKCETQNKVQEDSMCSSTISIPKQQDEDEAQRIRKFKSKGSFSRKGIKEEDNDFQLDMVYLKNYSSLQNLSKESSNKNEETSQINLKDFQVLKFLGAGAFGKVYMVRRRETKDTYALKIIPLPDNENQLLSIRNEHQIFKKIAGDHLVKAPFSFSHKNCHIFVLEYLPGGDLRQLLTEQIYFQEDRAKLYIAEIVLAIEHLHRYGIIHRDLKPQNLVIDRKGHLKLTDFGLSEFRVNQKLNASRKAEQERKNQRSGIRSNRKRRTALLGVNKNNMKLIGTPDYIAPEIIYQISYSNFTIDWWSLGVMAYQLIIGNRPFCADTIDEVVDNITNLNIDWPEVGYQSEMISPEAKDFIQRLLDKDFSQRLGAKGAEEIKKHPFLEGIDWQQLKSSSQMFIPHHMTKRSDMVTLQEDHCLRKQIEKIIGKGSPKFNDFQLETVIRFDLLKSETIQNMQKRKEQTNKKLKKLKSLRELNQQLQDQKENIEI